MKQEDLIPKFGEYSDNEPLDVPTMTTDFIKEHGFPCPDGYIFKDENGNVINATKIVLEEKKKDVDLTQEQINAMVHDSCVSFCKHCGCGVPRETCTSLGTCKEHDEYRAAIRTHLMEKKKKNEKEYPKTYEGCCKVLGVEGTWHVNSTEWEEYDKLTPYEKKLDYITSRLKQLLICRDAYWKLYGEEIGLDKPWEPYCDYNSPPRYVISCHLGDITKEKYCGQYNKPLSFPTEEMRDAFYEAFKEFIEQCKELL